MCTCFPHSLSIFFLCVLSVLCADVRENDYTFYPTQGQVTELVFFRDIYYQMVQLPDPAWLYILLMMKWISFDYDFSFKICCSSRKYISGTSRTDSPPLPPPGNKLQHKPCPPHFSWMPSRSPLYLTHPVSPKFELCLVKFNRGQGMLSRSILDRLSRTNESEMTIAYAQQGRLTCSIWSLQFEGLLPLVREVVRGSSGFRL